MSFFERDLPIRAKIYLLAVLAGGAPILFFSLYYSVTSTDFRWLYLACLTVFGSFFPVRIPSFRGKTQPVVVTTSDVFIFTAILLFRPEVAVTVAAIDSGLAATVSLKQKRPYKIIFNLTQLSLVTFVVGHIFYQLQGISPPLDVTRVDMNSFFLAL